MWLHVFVNLGFSHKILVSLIVRLICVLSSSLISSPNNWYLSLIRDGGRRKDQSQKVQRYELQILKDPKAKGDDKQQVGGPRSKSLGAIRLSMV